MYLSASDYTLARTLFIYIPSHMHFPRSSHPQPIATWSPGRVFEKHIWIRALTSHCWIATKVHYSLKLSKQVLYRSYMTHPTQTFNENPIQDMSAYGQQVIFDHKATQIALLRAVWWTKNRWSPLNLSRWHRHRIEQNWKYLKHTKHKIFPITVQGIKYAWRPRAVTPTGDSPSVLANLSS